MALDDCIKINGLDLDLLKYYALQQYARPEDLDKARSLYLEKHKLSEKEFYLLMSEFNKGVGYNARARD